MGWSSEKEIEDHNFQMETNSEYAAEFRQRMEEEYYYCFWVAETERFTDWFTDYRLDHKGYEEFNDPLLDVEIVGYIPDEDLPF